MSRKRVSEVKPVRKYYYRVYHTTGGYIVVKAKSQRGANQISTRHEGQGTTKRIIRTSKRDYDRNIFKLKWGRK